MIKILHMYSDLMNLYGDYGNLMFLTRALKKCGLDVEIDKCSVFDVPDFSHADMIFIGSGTEKARRRALEHLVKYADGFCDAYSSGKVILLTGNAMELIGEKIVSVDGNEIKALGIASFTVKETDKRTVRDVVFSGITEQKTVGFINRSTEIFGSDAPIFNVELGTGNNSSEKKEGWTGNNLYATHLIAPLLVRNPEWLKLFVKLLAADRVDVDSVDFSDNYAEKAHAVALRELEKRLKK